MTIERDGWSVAGGLLALMQLRGVGPAKAIAVARGDLDVDLFATPGDLEVARRAARDIAERSRDAGARLVGYFDDEFPAALRGIAAAPAVLYVAGPAAAWAEPTLGVVGTREPSTFGETATRELTRLAARSGISIVSGLARGVDGVAHRAALDESGRTVAVLGSGLDVVTPREHRELAERILAAGGALLSEQAPGTPPSAGSLVARNRLQAGLSQALLVGQTGTTGGTLHTVRFAAEQHRPIFCPQPHQHHAASEGLYVLLECPANELPSRLPAWAKHQRFADSLGDRPVARPITAGGADDWVAGLLDGSVDVALQDGTGDAVVPGRDVQSEQLTFESLE